MNWLEKAYPPPNGWAALFRELQTLIASLPLESEVEWRGQYFTSAVDELRQRAAALAGTPEEIDFQFHAGQAGENFGALDLALTAYQRAVELCDTHRFHSQKAQALRWVGNVYARQNQWQPAQQAYDQSLQLCVQIGDDTGQAQAENGLGSLGFEQGDFNQASAHWERALELAEKIKAAYLAAVVYNNLGALANVQGQSEKALAYYGASLPRFEAAGEARSLASTYHNMAMSHADHENWAEASINYEKSFRLAQQIGDVHLQALVKLNRVELYLALGDAAVAAALCQQALQTYEHVQDRLGEADAYKFLGMISAQKRGWTKAKTYFEKSIALTMEFQHPLGEAEARLEYGRMLKQKGAARLAAEQFEQALTLFQKVNASVDVEKVKQEMGTI